MKFTMKLSAVVAAIAVISTSAAFADNQQMQNLLAIQRAQNPDAARVTTVAVYTDGRGVGSSTAQQTKSEARFELRSNPHGQFYPAWVPAT